MSTIESFKGFDFVLPGGGVCSSTHFAPAAHGARSLRSLPLRCAARSLGAGSFRKQTPPTGQNRKVEMNNVRLIGRLTKDPELSERSGTKVCDMRLAVNNPGNAPTTFIDVVVFGERADASSEFEKGAQVEVAGSLRYSEWEAKSSPKAKSTQKRSKHSVIVRELAAA